MPFTMPNYPMLRPQQANPLARNFIADAMNAYQGATETKYLPMRLQAEAASKLAYANLMGPQFLAKLMGNQDILANMDENQRNAALNLVYRAGTGQGTGRAFFNPSVKDVLSNNINQNNPSQYETSSDEWNQFNPSMNSNSMENNEYSMMEKGKTFPEKAAEYKGIQEEGRKSGEFRAEAVKKYGEMYQSGLSLGDKFNELKSLFNNPEFANMRKDIPFFQEKQLKVLSKIGSPYQQQLIGNLITTSQEVVRDTINTFTGQRLKSEIDISNNMKVSPDDTIDVAIGKLKASMLYKDLNMKRIRIASDLMENKHISERKAIEEADKMVNGSKIREEIEKSMDYPVTIHNKKTGEVITVPVSVARKKYGAKNV